jgi:anti-sigma-K factor RskA
LALTQSPPSVVDIWICAANHQLIASNPTGTSRMSNSSAEPTTPAAPSTHPAFWAGWIAAAGFAVATAYFGANYFATRSALAVAVNEAEFTRLEAQSLAQRLEAEHILSSSYIATLQKSGDLANLQIVKLTDRVGSAPQPVATALWNPLGRSGLLLVDSLPVLQDNQEYQLWSSALAGENPVSSGLFTVDASGAARLPFSVGQSASAVTTFTITRENKGGSSSTPQGPVIATGTL